MANMCNFSMYVKGNHGDIEQFYNAMSQKGNVYMGRGAEAEIIWDDDDVAVIDGWCKWSVISSLVDNAVSMRSEPNKWAWSAEDKEKDLEFVTLFEACKKWNLVLEVYSEECGNEFQEHYICDKGEVTCNECVEWHEHCLDDHDTKEEAEEELDIEITDEEWEDGGFISRGGFANWDFEI